MRLTGGVSAGEQKHIHQNLLGGPPPPPQSWIPVHLRAPGSVREGDREVGKLGGREVREKELTSLGGSKFVKNPKKRAKPP